MDDDYVGIWELYGLQTDPFTTSPILLKGGLISPESFMGRQEETKRLEKLFRSNGGSRSIVCGMQGVGKTTLVNMSRLIALNKGYFTPYKEIKVDANWNINDFIMNTISAIYSSLLTVNNSKKNQEMEKIISELRPIFDSYEKTDKSYSVSTPVLGGGYGKTTAINHPEMNTTWLYETFETLIEKLRKKLGFKEIIIHYNNLDTFDEDEEELKKLFNGIRDFIQIPYVHFVFVGSPTTSSIIHSIPRVSNIINDTPINVEPLILADVQKIIEYRIKNCEINGMKSINPTNHDCIELLYNLHNGNLRAILNSLSTAVRSATDEKPITLTKQSLSKILFEVAQKRFMDKITPTMQIVLKEMLKQRESTNTSLASKLKKHPQNISKYLNTLKENQCINLIRVDGREKFYGVAEWIKWLMLDSAKGVQSQITQF